MTQKSNKQYEDSMRNMLQEKSKKLFISSLTNQIEKKVELRII